MYFIADQAIGNCSTRQGFVVLRGHSIFAAGAISSLSCSLANARSTKSVTYGRSLSLRHSQKRSVNRSQYPTKKIRTQRTNPSIPLPSIVRHACITAITAAAIAIDLHDAERRLARGSFSGFSFIASYLCSRRHPRRWQHAWNYKKYTP